MSVRRVALLSAGGFAPCLSTAIGNLISRYNELDPSIEIIAFQYGYWGLLKGEYVVVDDEARAKATDLDQFGGSPIGNSRVKLTNVEDLVARGLIEPGQEPLQVAADRLREAGVDVLHTIGGDDTNTTAADLAAFLQDNDYDLTVVGLPKTIDNDIIPIRQSLGASTAADQTALFATNIVGENRSGPRMLIIHEIMGRNCGWLAAESTRRYMDSLDSRPWVPSIGLSKAHWSVDALYLPEMHMDLREEASRLRKIMDERGNVNIFISEGAGVPEILEEMEAKGEDIPRDPFGHVRLNDINPGEWFAKQFAEQLGAEKVMVQKSGYFARSAASNQEDLRLIQSMTDLAVQRALERVSGVIGHDEENGDKLEAIEFSRIAGGKTFDLSLPWFVEMMQGIGQTVEAAEK